MNHNIIETAMGAVVLGAAGIFMVFAMKTADIDTSTGYPLQASFANASGLLVGSDVRIGGVGVGKVSALSLDPTSFQAIATLTIEDEVKLPDDSSATIRSESLMGGKFLAIEPGGSETNLESGGKIEYTQSTPDLEQMLGQAIFSMSQSKPSEGEASTPATPTAQP